MSTIYNRSKRKDGYDQDAESTAYSRTTEPTPRNGIIKDTTVTFRMTPNPNGKSLGFLAPGTKVRIIEEVGDFYKIELDLSRVGFVLSRFCEEV